MYVDQIVLEGFKTYMNRTVIERFDRNFNAITGLNGSGKSNILDAIQFLIGSTSKEMLRLKSGLTQVIYKQGFAGIQKASVTIKFKCPDKEKRPSGYQNCQELLITRQITKDKVSKIFVNGLSSNLSKVKTLFRSVNLNIQNPHFLVKQGQITKIISLKGTQLLGMIQQTAGTAYYNRTKMQSQNLMQKKETKLQSVEQILNTNIIPQMQKLNSDRRKYNVFKQKQSLMKKLSQQIKSYQFVTKSNFLRRAQNQIIPIKQQVTSYKKQVQSLELKIRQIQGNLKIQRDNNNNGKTIEEYNKMKKTINQLSNNIDRAQKRIKSKEVQIVNAQKEKFKYQQEMQQVKKDKEWKLKRIAQNQTQAQSIQGLIIQIQSSNGAQQAKELLQKQKRQLTSQFKSLETEKKLLMQKKTILKAQAQNQQKNKDQMIITQKTLKEQLSKLQKQITQYSKVKKPDRINDPASQNSLLSKLQQQTSQMLSKNFHLNLRYQNPVQNFDRSSVIGKMFMLFTSVEEKYEKALQIGAGGKLFNIVVQDEKTSQLLIQKDSFGKSVTIVPLNKIKPKNINPDIVNAALSIAKKNNAFANLASKLVQFDSRLKNAIDYAFGDFIVCQNANVAKAIAFNPNRMLCLKCVTLQGDVYQSGTLTGGASRNQMSILRDYRRYSQIQNQFKQQQKKNLVNKEKYEIYIREERQYKQNQNQIEIRKQKIQKINQKLLQISMNNKQRNFQQEEKDLQDKIKVISSQLDISQANIKNVQKKLQGSINIDDQKKQLIKQKSEIEKKLKVLKKQASHAEIQLEQLLNEIKNVQNNQQQDQDQIKSLDEKKRNMLQQMQKLTLSFRQLQEIKQKQSQQQIQNAKKIDQYKKQLSQLKNQYDKIQQKSNKAQDSLILKQKQIKTLNENLKKLMDQNQWLAPQKDYQLPSNFNYEQAIQNYKQQQRQAQFLKKTAKLNIDQMSFNKLQDQYKDLISKKQTLLNDKKTLLHNIHDLDLKRTQTLNKCFIVVKENLSRIFSDLLNGASAHLSKINQHDITEGVQISVQFNGVKKQLGQLSGGQRSLLALSFILSLLLYKPSPFYILDEIDSALDQSHTQNIGAMIQERFPQSQFILISLKDGMFQNANVLYKVSFVDGESRVERQVLKKNK